MRGRLATQCVGSLGPDGATPLAPRPQNCEKASGRNLRPYARGVSPSLSHRDNPPHGPATRTVSPFSQHRHAQVLATLLVASTLLAGCGGENEALLKLHYNNLSQCRSAPVSVTVYDEAGTNLGAVGTKDFTCEEDGREPGDRGVILKADISLPDANQYVLDIQGDGLNIGTETLPAISYRQAQEQDWVLPDG